MKNQNENVHSRFVRSAVRALSEAGVSVCTSVPGGSGVMGDTFELFCSQTSQTHLYSLHEEVAFTLAHGAAIVGRRAACLIKAHGLAKAANSVIDSLAAGNVAGFVTLVFDDPLGSHSDSIFETERFLSGMEACYGVLGPDQDARAVILDCFRRSEEQSLPYFLIVDLTQQHSQRALDYNAVALSVIPPAYERDPLAHVVCPLFSSHQRNVFLAKKRGDDWRKLIRPEIPDLFKLPSSAGRSAECYVPFFDVFRKLRGSFVSGDTSTSSLYALAPYHCVDVVTYMGGSIPLAIGAFMAGRRDAWALTGDFSFVSAGHLGLLEALQREIPLKVVIFNDDLSTATGGQRFDDRPLNRILDGYGSHVRRIHDHRDDAEIENTLVEADRSDQLRIIVARVKPDVECQTGACIFLR